MPTQQFDPNMFRKAGIVEELFSYKTKDASQPSDDLMLTLIEEIRGLRADIARKKWLSDEDLRWFQTHIQPKP